MEELFNDFEKLQKEFHETVENYPLLEDDINKIFDEDIKELEELLEKNDEYYMKKAVKNLTALIEEIKEKSVETKECFNKFEKLAKIWDEIDVNQNIDEKVLNRLNNDMKKSHELICGKSLKEIKEAIKLFNVTIKELKEYQK